MKIGFYTYGNHRMGLGHVYRCLALAEIFNNNWPEAKLVFELKKFTDGIIVVKANFDGLINCWEPLDVPENRWDILVVDQLSVDPVEMNHLKKKTRLLLSIDDAGPGHYQADIAFNTLYRCVTKRPNQSTTVSYWGLDYLVLGNHFAGQHYVVREKAKEVFLSQGGADTYGIIPMLLERMSDWLNRHPDLNLNVHIGSAFKHEPELENAIRRNDDQIVCRRDVRDMPSLLSEMDIAITSIGMMAFELATIGVPSILITGEEKELQTARLLQHETDAYNLGLYSDLVVDEIKAKLELMIGEREIRSQLSSKLRRAVDGMGGERIAKIVKAAIDGKSNR